MSKLLRHAVSKQKKRFKQDGFDLDLAYITKRIIAMGFPSEKTEAVYRNPITQVYKFFEKYHKDHYKLYNLCAERKYDIAKFHGRVSQYPFEDHNAPPLDMISKCCIDITEWLAKDSENIVGINCKAGKGRTGLIICCYLLHSKQFEDTDTALKFYGEKRTKDGKGVTIASQQRYIRYYEQILKIGRLPEIMAFYLNSIKLSPPIITTGDVVAVIIIKGQEVGETKTGDNKVVTIADKGEKSAKPLDVLELTCKGGIPIMGDVKIQLASKKKGTAPVKLCHFWINTSFIGKDNTYTLYKNEIDVANKDKKGLIYPAEFKVELLCNPVGGEVKSPTPHKKHKKKIQKIEKIENSDSSYESSKKKTGCLFMTTMIM